MATKVKSLQEILASVVVARSGQFYELTSPLTESVVKKTFSSVAVSLDAQQPVGFSRPPDWPSNLKVWRQIRAPASHTWSHKLSSAVASTHKVTAVASAMVHPFVRVPLISPSSGLLEHRVGFLLLLEMEVENLATKVKANYLYVQRELVADPVEESLKGFCKEIPSAAFIEPFYSSKSKSRIERMSMRKIASSRGEVNRKILEAYDVESAVSSFGLHRTIAGAMQIATPAGSTHSTMGISAHTSRLRSGASRIKLAGVVEWATDCAARLSEARGTTKSSTAFLSEMAQPVKSLLDKIPMSLVFDHLAIEQEQMELTAGGHTGCEIFAGSAVATFEELIAILREPVEFKPQPCDAKGDPLPAGKAHPEQYFFPAATSGATAPISVVRLRVTAQTCSVEMPADFGTFGVDRNGQALRMGLAISKLRAMRVTFDKGQILYCMEGAFQTSNMRLSVTQIGNMLTPVPGLTGVHSEKGKDPGPADTNFDTVSSFYAIENSTEITSSDSILICDDAIDEWCDYLEIGKTKPRMRWLHAKVQQIERATDRAHRKAAAPGSRPKITQPMSSSDSLSASDLQEVIGQAIKNLARLRMSTEEDAVKKRVLRWQTGECKLPKVAKIKRLRRPFASTVAEISARITAAISSPLAVLEVGIVIPNYSAATLNNEFNKIAAGQAEPQIAQAFWLLSSYMNSCLEVGATPYVFVRP